MNRDVKIIRQGVSLPRCFAVIDASSYKEAVVSMRQAFANPETHLVVWNGAAALLNKAVQETLGQLQALSFRDMRAEKKIVTPFQRTLGKIFPDRFSHDALLHDHFNEITGELGVDVRVLRPLYEQSRDFSSALSTVLEAQSNFADFRSEMPRGKPVRHRDRLPPDTVLALRVLLGEKTIYFDSDDITDVDTHMLRCGTVVDDIVVKPDAQEWVIEDGGIAFHSSFIGHAAPWGSQDKRMLQCYQVKARHNIMAADMLTL